MRSNHHRAAAIGAVALGIALAAYTGTHLSGRRIRAAAADKPDAVVYLGSITVTPADTRQSAGMDAAGRSLRQNRRDMEVRTREQARRSTDYPVAAALGLLRSLMFPR